MPQSRVQALNLSSEWTAQALALLPQIEEAQKAVEDRRRK